MFIDQATKRLNCSRSLLGKMIKSGKIKAELKIRKSGHKSYNITTPIEEIKAVLPKRTGYKRNGQSKVKSGTFLQTVIEWRAVTEAKRPILITLSKLSLSELRLLLDLTK